MKYHCNKLQFSLDPHGHNVHTFIKIEILDGIFLQNRSSLSRVITKIENKFDRSFF
jgi:hypothetical protein